MRPQPTDASAAPKTCPFCNSADIKTTSKNVTAATYWRCASCGQVWNAGRLSPGWRRATGRFT
jgi:transposase-like protein